MAVTSNGACVCLDTGGWIACALDDSIRRHTGSDDSNLLRVVTGQWGAREVPAGAAVPFKLRLHSSFPDRALKAFSRMFPFLLAVLPTGRRPPFDK